MRRVFAILQLLLLVLPALAPVATLHASRSANLPACCRRNGAHHCQLAASAIAARDGIGISATPGRCPLYPHALPSAQHAPSSLAPASLIFAQVVSHPAVHAQTIALRRIARDRARQKRGPPVLA